MVQVAHCDCHSLRELELIDLYSPPHPGNVPRAWLAHLSVTDAPRSVSAWTRVALWRVFKWLRR